MFVVALIGAALGAAVAVHAFDAKPAPSGPEPVAPAVVASAPAASAAARPAASKPAHAASAKKSASVAGHGAATKTITHPTWKELTPAQQQTLKPLQSGWDTLDDPRKRKWLTMAQNFARLSPTEQAKLQERMTDWTDLSSQERSRARLNFAETKELTAEQKEERWQAYQKLSGEEKRALAREASKDLTSAAMALKPVEAKKLAVPAPVKPASGTAVLPIKPAITPVLAAASAPKVDRKTLLPRPPALPASKPAPKPAAPPPAASAPASAAAPASQ